MIGISRLYCGSAEASDAIRYAKHRSAPKPVLVWNCTRQCNLSCLHCYSRSDALAARDELSTQEARSMLQDAAGYGCPVVLFSGGEPMMRGDIMQLIAYATSLGLRTVLSTNGTLIDKQAAQQLASAGVGYVGVSLDGLESVHDKFRGRSGAFQSALRAIRLCRQAGVKTGVRFTLCRRNVQEIDSIFKLLRDEDIPRACFYHLVYSGRGESLSSEDLSHDQTRLAVDRIIDNTAELFADGMKKEILTVDNHADGPHLYMRMLREGNPRAEEAGRMLRMAGGNSSGRGIGCVSWDGTVHPDQFWRQENLGNIRHKPFSAIWSDESNETLRRLRNSAEWIKGRCLTCRFLDMCGGNFRSRALSATGDAWQSDPACYLSDEEIKEDKP